MRAILLRAVFHRQIMKREKRLVSFLPPYGGGNGTETYHSLPRVEGEKEKLGA